MVERPVGKRPRVRPERIWDDNIKRIFKECGGETWTEFLCPRIGTGAGVCQWGDEPSGSIKYGEVFD